MTFDSALPGTSATAWRDHGRMDAVPPLDLDPVRALVVVAAHPDDETLGAGGLIAVCARRGIPTRVVVVTDGAGSHPRSLSIGARQLASLRAQEERAAVAALDPAAALHLLPFPDGGTREHVTAITRTLEAVLADVEPGTLLVAPWRGDGHRDHRVVGEICAALAERAGIRFAEYPIWLWHWASPESAEVPWGRFARLRLEAPERDAKAAAIAEFGSQTQPLSDREGDEAMLTPEFLQHFRAEHEIFVVGAASLPGRYFDELYEHHDDPWGFDRRWYETRKRALTLAALPGERYRSALEIGCSIGVLTEAIAERCDQVLGIDLSAAAVERARHRVALRAGVRIEQLDAAERFPDGTFDLILLSEVGYYFAQDVLARLIVQAQQHLAADGVVLLCHWRHPVQDYPLRGDEVHAVMAQTTTLGRLLRHEEEDFLLEVYSADGRSVARRTGLAP